MRNTLYKAYLDDFSHFVHRVGGTTREVMGELLSFEVGPVLCVCVCSVTAAGGAEVWLPMLPAWLPWLPCGRKGAKSIRLHWLSSSKVGGAPSSLLSPACLPARLPLAAG
jgi:hypothetical protein